MTRLFTVLIGLACACGSALGERDETHTLDLVGDGAVRVENFAGAIEVTAWDEPKLEIDAELQGSAELVLSGDEQHRVVRVENKSRGGTTSRLRLRLPRNARVDASAMSSDISIDGPSGERVVAESVSGDIRVVSGARRLQLESVSGDIDLDAQGSSRVTALSVSGDVRVSNASGEARLESVSGDIVFAGRDIDRMDVETVSGDADLDVGLTPDGRLDAELLNGKLSLTVDADLDARVEISTFSGDIDSDFGSVEKKGYGSSKILEATAGAGTGVVSIKTYNGDVKLRKR